MNFTSYTSFAADCLYSYEIVTLPKLLSWPLIILIINLVPIALRLPRNLTMSHWLPNTSSHGPSPFNGFLHAAFQPLFVEVICSFIPNSQKGEEHTLSRPLAHLLASVLCAHLT